MPESFSPSTYPEDRSPEMSRSQRERNFGGNNLIARIFKGPMRFLVKARDMYMRGISHCSDRCSYGAMFGIPSCHVPTPSGSFSGRGSRDDFRELVRAASLRERARRVDAGVGRYRRSHSSKITRIDEDRPCEFGGDDDCGVKKTQLFARSKSYSNAVRGSAIYD